MSIKNGQIAVIWELNKKYFTPCFITRHLKSQLYYYYYYKQYISSWQSYSPLAIRISAPLKKTELHHCVHQDLASIRKLGQTNCYSTNIVCFSNDTGSLAITPALHLATSWKALQNSIQSRGELKVCACSPVRRGCGTQVARSFIAVVALILFQVQHVARLSVEEYSLSEMSFATGRKVKKFAISVW